MRARETMKFKSRPRPVIVEGAQTKPSVRSMTGKVRRQARMVMTEKRLMLSRGFSPPMIFLLSTLRDWKVRLDPMAARKPAQLKDSSVAEASATPPAMGTSDATTAAVGWSPKKIAERTTEKKGSMALMVCVKDTATLPRLTLVSRLPSACTAASGRILSTSSLVIFGALCTRRVHMLSARREPTANCSQVHEMGTVKSFRTCLFAMLK